MARTGIAIACAQCGMTSGHADARANGGTRIRCDSCGQFSERTDRYCAEHDVRLDRLPTGYSRCPYCQERDRVEQMRHEQMARRADPNMHPSVDAPRR